MTTPNNPTESGSASSRRYIIGQHLIFHAYGLWLPNDPRGSGSDEIRKQEIEALGPVHTGRKVVQPPRAELKRFYRQAASRLEFAPIWFDSAKRQAIGEAFSEVTRERQYTVWACAVLANHAHICIRRHKDSAERMWRLLAQASRNRVRLSADVADAHPVWSNRIYKVYLFTPEDVLTRIRYIEQNPAKEGSQPQQWDFVSGYDGWPIRAAGKSAK